MKPVDKNHTYLYTVNILTREHGTKGTICSRTERQIEACNIWQVEYKLGLEGIKAINVAYKHKEILK